VNPKDFRQQLEELQQAIEKADKVDESGQRLLRQLDTHIRELLERSGDAASAARPELATGLQDAIRHFEVTHPGLTAALSDLLTTLSNAGI
jgi:ABC-type transporter Mla subunit MlaD